MNKLTEQLKSVLIPKAALIAYEYEGESGMRNDYFLELREIDENGKMGEAMPVTYDFMNTIATHFSEAHNGIPYGEIPRNLLYADTRRGTEKYIWSNPACKRMMYFTPGLEIENDRYHVPGIIYVVSTGSLHIYAYKDEKLSENTELFTAPFFNTTNGSVCLGTSKLEKPANPTYGELMEYWEKKFWLTEFSHLGGGGNPTKSNLVLVTKAARNEQFNTDELKKTNKKLKDILK